MCFPVIQPINSFNLQTCLLCASHWDYKRFLSSKEAQFSRGDSTQTNMTSTVWSPYDQYCNGVDRRSQVYTEEGGISRSITGQGTGRWNSWPRRCWDAGHSWQKVSVCSVTPQSSGVKHSSVWLQRVADAQAVELRLQRDRDLAWGFLYAVEGR